MKNNTNTVGVGFHPDPRKNKYTNHNANPVGVDAHIDPQIKNHKQPNANPVGVDAHIDPQTTKPKSITINITNLSEEQKAKLRGAIKFFSGDKNNIAINVKNNEQILPCGAIYLTKEILEQFEEIVGKENLLINH